MLDANMSPHQQLHIDAREWLRTSRFCTEHHRWEGMLLQMELPFVESHPLTAITTSFLFSLSYFGDITRSNSDQSMLTHHRSKEKLREMKSPCRSFWKTSTGAHASPMSSRWKSKKLNLEKARITLLSDARSMKYVFWRRLLSIFQFEEGIILKFPSSRVHPLVRRQFLGKEAERSRHLGFDSGHCPSCKASRHHRYYCRIQ
jgi:hypothetical protein